MGSFKDGADRQMMMIMPSAEEANQVVDRGASIGLKSRLSLLPNVNKSGTKADSPLITREEKMEAFQFLYQTTPYLAFGYVAANEATCQASQHLLHLTKESLDLREGDPLFVNSIMHLHKYVKESRGSLTAVLQAIRNLRPTLLTVEEQDGNHNGPFFLGSKSTSKQSTANQDRGFTLQTQLETLQHMKAQIGSRGMKEKTNDEGNQAKRDSKLRAA
ncbi:Transcription factor GRAS [Dillenia turbinata]|uniref:Transcription factor GRAS n=1 Tax=Dillenia turbinata TaxID=194707 RepID=A0AAN8ZE49_9MAGN